MADNSSQASIYEDALTPTRAPGEVTLEADESEVETIRPIQTRVSNTPSFAGIAFEDFQLDLTCLSTPPSPAQSSHSPLPDESLENRPRSPSPASSLHLARSTSFGSQLPSISLKLSTKKASAPQLSSTPSKNASRGSWPLNKYAGRGTPVDRGRRYEWAGLSRTDVSEDGLLSLRSGSLDLGFRPLSRPGSPEWRTNVVVSSTRSNSTASESFAPPIIVEPAPALAPLSIGGDKPDEWDSIIKTVLASVSEKPEVDEAGGDSPGRSDTQPPLSPGVSQEGEVQSPQDTIVATPIISQEHIDVLNGLDIDLGLNAALDLGLGQKGGMNWFNFGLIPTSGCGGTDTPSIYSQPHTPQISPLPSARPSQSGSRPGVGMGGSPVDYVTSKSTTLPWWKRVIHRFRKVQTLIAVIHKQSP